MSFYFFAELLAELEEPLIPLGPPKLSTDIELLSWHVLVWLGAQLRFW